MEQKWTIKIRYHQATIGYAFEGTYEHAKVFANGILAEKVRARYLLTGAYKVKFYTLAPGVWIAVGRGGYTVNSATREGALANFDKVRLGTPQLVHFDGQLVEYSEPAPIR